MLDYCVKECWRGYWPSKRGLGAFGRGLSGRGGMGEGVVENAEGLCRRMRVGDEKVDFCCPFKSVGRIFEDCSKVGYFFHHFRLFRRY